MLDPALHSQRRGVAVVELLHCGAGGEQLALVEEEVLGQALLPHVGDGDVLEAVEEVRQGRGTALREPGDGEVDLDRRPGRQLVDALGPVRPARDVEAHVQEHVHHDRPNKLIRASRGDAQAKGVHMVASRRPKTDCNFRRHLTLRRRI